MEKIIKTYYKKKIKQIISMKVLFNIAVECIRPKAVVAVCVY